MAEDTFDSQNETVSSLISLPLSLLAPKGFGLGLPVLTSWDFISHDKNVQAAAWP